MVRRWDGLWVCEEDWEPRHPMDYFRTINDVHVLPFILSNYTQVETTWTPVFANLASSSGTGSISYSGIYTVKDSIVDFVATINITGNATVWTAPGDGPPIPQGTMSLPLPCVVAGTNRVFDGYGNYLLTPYAIANGCGIINALDTTILIPRDIPPKNTNIIVMGTYGA